MTQNDDCYLERALNHIPQFPTSCIRCLAEFPEDYAAQHYDFTMSVEIATTSEECLSVLEDIVLCGRFCLNETVYLVKQVKQGPGDRFRLFTRPLSDDKVLTIEAVGLTKEHWQKEHVPINGSLHCASAA